MAIDQQLSDLPSLANLPASNGNIYLRNDNEPNVADKDQRFDLAAKVAAMDSAIASAGGGLWEEVGRMTVTATSATLTVTSLGTYKAFKVTYFGAPLNAYSLALSINGISNYDFVVYYGALAYQTVGFTHSTLRGAANSNLQLIHELRAEKAEFFINYIDENVGGDKLIAVTGTGYSLNRETPRIQHFWGRVEDTAIAPITSISLVGQTSSQLENDNGTLILEALA